VADAGKGWNHIAADEANGTIVGLGSGVALPPEPQPAAQPVVSISAASASVSRELVRWRIAVTSADWP